MALPTKFIKKQGGFINLAALLCGGGADSVDRGTLPDGAQSLLLNGTSQYLERTFSTPTTQNTWTYSEWIKKCDISQNQVIFGNSAGSELFYFKTTDTIAAYDGSDVVSTGVFRDTHDYLHVVINFNGTTCNVWVNNVLAISTASHAFTLLNTAVGHRIGNDNANYYFGGYRAHGYFIDGTALTPDTFGHVSSSTGKWVADTPTGLTFGNNGHLLDFIDSDGSDTSGNGNDWTESGSPTYSSDTPVNNFATLNPLLKTGDTFTSGNLVTYGTGGDGGFPTMSFDVEDESGFYWEYGDGSTTGNGSTAGVLFFDSGHPDMDMLNYPLTDLSAVDAGLFVYGRGASASNNWDSRVKTSGGGAPSQNLVGAWASTDRIGILVRGGKVWLRVNGDWVDEDFAAATSPDTDDTGAILTGLTGNAWPIQMSDQASAAFPINFGATDFNYTVPTDSKVLSTANLPTPSKLSNLISIVTATETNIVSELAASNSYTNSLRIYKNQDSVEDWYYNFSHDESNAHHVEATPTYAAFPTLSGSDDFIGIEINADSDYGTAIGSSVVSGSDETIVDNTGSTRKVIIVFNRAGGNIFVHHPDMTSGELMYLNTVADDFASTAITSVTTNGFTLDQSVIGNGTYDYLVISDLSDLVFIGKGIGNGIADGGFTPMSIAPIFELMKRRGAGGEPWRLWTYPPKVNGVGSFLTLNTDAAQSSDSGNRVDLVSNGVKRRGTNSAINANGGEYLEVAFGLPVSA
tara:strand:- start:731 stop:2965 length:2235 start_codon:yes stop_codon:yes gene_type:complete